MLFAVKNNKKEKNKSSAFAFPKLIPLSDFKKFLEELKCTGLINLVFIGVTFSDTKLGPSLKEINDCHH